MPNLQLSTEEMQLVSDPAWILTKQRIIEKVYGLFGNLSAQMQLHMQEANYDLPQQVLQHPPKISRGEQYEALPYVVLDYPRFFSKEDVFSVRIFFWWGNYFSITLHLKGKFQEALYAKITAAVTGKRLHDFYFSEQGNEFSFNLHGNNYFFCGEKNNFPRQTEQQQFLKISYKIPFSQWDMAEQLLLQAFLHLMSTVAN